MPTAHEIGWWKGTCRRLQSGSRAHCDSSRTHQKLSRYKILKAAAENESQKMIVMTGNARELSMGEMRQTCEQEGIKLYTSVRYSPELNGAAERTIGVLNNAVRAMPHDSSLPSPMGGVQCSDICA